jgi:hypothetical protein
MEADHCAESLMHVTATVSFGMVTFPIEAHPRVDAELIHFPEGARLEVTEFPPEGSVDRRLSVSAYSGAS